nr:gliding motility-associated C-terminal domain-containing protein [Saprospiraceae bacterium]
TLVSSFGCDSIRTVSITGVSRYIPNVFSPNQDNINDVFEIVAFPINEIELTYFVIFDRFGNMVYENRSWPIKWDGRDKKGEFYNPAVFTYLLTYLCNHKEVIETGNITLIR